MQHENVIGKMDKKVKKAWLKALRSGEYKQGRAALVNNNNEFCCLGVLCNLHAEAHPGADEAYFEDTYYMEQAGHLPKAVAEWAGIDLEQGNISIPVNLPYTFRATSKVDNKRETFNVKGEKDSGGFLDEVSYDPWTLVQLNDHGANFKQIADVIEYSL